MEIMKKIISIVTVLIIIVGVFALTGCGKNEKKDEKAAIVGKWKLESNEDVNCYYIFNEDGTGVYELNGVQLNFKFEDKGDKILITYEGNEFSSELKYKVEEDTLVTTNDINEIKKYKKQQ